MNKVEMDPLVGPRPPSWWTGPIPNEGKAIQALPQLNLSTCTRSEILAYFNNGWLISEVLFSAIQGEQAFARPPYHSLRHPLIFYYAHPAVLYVNKLRVSGFLKEPVNAHLEHLFEVGVDEMSWDDMSKNEMQWPSVAEVTEYRRQVYQLIRNIIETHPRLAESAKPFSIESPVWALAMGFEHERIHIETSSVLIRELPLQYVIKPNAWPSTPLPTPASATPASEAMENKMCAVDGRSVTLGKPLDEPTFGWDNEYGRRESWVRPFEASRFLISNGEFLKFVEDGGYRDSEYWSEQGWTWRQFRNTKWPAFWLADGPAGLGKFKIRRLFDEVDFDASLPVVVNYHEAKAYCHWLSKNTPDQTPYRLITEAEHHRLRQESLLVSGERPGQQRRNNSWNLNLRFGGEVSVFDSLHGNFADVFGNLWQWCEDDFNPLPGFKVHKYYEDFSTPCFDGKHKMILGGSFMSTGDEAGPWARYHFRPHFHQHAGFRLARSLNANPEAKANPESDAVLIAENIQLDSNYESTDLLNQYLLLHFAANADVLPYAFAPHAALNFPQRCAEIITDFATRLKLPTGKALDIGCAVGGSTFELAKTYEQVIGVDLSASFISAAQVLKSTGSLSYYRKNEGLLGQPMIAQVDPAVPRERTSFRQADATSLPADFVDFDAVLLANLLCRLPSPRSCLARMGGPRGVVKKGGLLVLLSPYSWLEDHTPKESWLGGFEKHGHPIRSAEALAEILGTDFECLQQEDVPLIIREHARKFQYIVSHLMVWRRK